MPTQVSFCATTALISPRHGHVKIVRRLRGVNNHRKENRFTKVSKLIYSVLSQLSKGPLCPNQLSQIKVLSIVGKCEMLKSVLLFNIIKTANV